MTTISYRMIHRIGKYYREQKEHLQQRAADCPSERALELYTLPSKDKETWEGLGKDQRTSSVLCFRMGNTATNLWRKKKIRTSQLVIDPFISELQNLKYSETSIHRFCRGSEKETMDPGKQ
jgi:hypothetical protein